MYDSDGPELANYGRFDCPQRSWEQEDGFFADLPFGREAVRIKEHWCGPLAIRIIVGNSLPPLITCCVNLLAPMVALALIIRLALLGPDGKIAITVHISGW